MYDGFRMTPEAPAREDLRQQRTGDRVFAAGVVLYSVAFVCFFGSVTQSCQPGYASGATVSANVPSLLYVARQAVNALTPFFYCIGLLVFIRPSVTAGKFIGGWFAFHFFISSAFTGLNLSDSDSQSLLYWLSEASWNGGLMCASAAFLIPILLARYSDFELN